MSTPTDERAETFEPGDPPLPVAGSLCENAVGDVYRYTTDGGWVPVNVSEPDDTFTTLLERVGPEALERITTSDDPVSWLVRAANCYAKRQERSAKRKETRKYADRAEYLRTWAARKRQSGSGT